MSLEALRSHRRRILELAARHGAPNVRVFGSTVRGEARLQSDIDLEEALGCSVQVLTDAGSRPYLQQRILADAATL